MLLIEKKESQIKIQPWVRANRPSNNWAQVTMDSVRNFKHGMKGLSLNPDISNASCNVSYFSGDFIFQGKKYREINEN